MIERDIEKRAAAYVEDLLPDCISLLCRMTAVEAPRGTDRRALAGKRYLPAQRSIRPRGAVDGHCRSGAPNGRLLSA